MNKHVISFVFNKSYDDYNFDIYIDNKHVYTNLEFYDKFVEAFRQYHNRNFKRHVIPETSFTVKLTSEQFNIFNMLSVTDLNNNFITPVLEDYTENHMSTINFWLKLEQAVQHTILSKLSDSDDC